MYIREIFFERSDSMNIQQLDTERILISLSQNDMAHCCISFDDLSMSDEHSSRVLKQLMIKAAASTGASFSGKQVIIEAMKYDSGCLLLITLKDKAHKRKVYRVSRARDIISFSFGNAEDFLRCMAALYRLGEKRIRSSAFLCENKYYLVINSYIAIKNNVVRTAMEFAVCKADGRVFAAHLAEHGRMLASGNAIAQIGAPLTERR